MLHRKFLLSSTFLTGLACGVGLTAPALAQKSSAAPSYSNLPAVDGVNGKFEAFGGSYARNGLYGVGGSVSVPLNGPYGVQVDGTAASFAGRFMGVAGGHLFWRDPRQGLIGVYGDYTHWSQYGGVHIGRVGAEGEAYFGRWTLYGLAGAEFGNNSATTTFGTSTSPIPGGGTLTTQTALSSLTNVTRFFDRITLSYYITDNWKASIGHRYLGGRHALSLGTEYAVPTGGGPLASVFAQARLGSRSGDYGLWGGIRFYFGKDKSLIRRHREDDPVGDSTAESLFGIANSLGPTFTNANASCPPGEVFLGGACLPLPP